MDGFCKGQRRLLFLRSAPRDFYGPFHPLVGFWSELRRMKKLTAKWMNKVLCRDVAAHPFHAGVQKQLDRRRSHRRFICGWGKQKGYFSGAAFLWKSTLRSTGTHATASCLLHFTRQDRTWLHDHWPDSGEQRLWRNRHACMHTWLMTRSCW